MNNSLWLIVPCSWNFYNWIPEDLVLFFPCFCRIRFCLMIYRTLGLSLFLLLFFEPLSIAFETLQVNSLEFFRMMISVCDHIGLSVNLLLINFTFHQFVYGNFCRQFWFMAFSYLIYGFIIQLETTQIVSSLSFLIWQYLVLSFLTHFVPFNVPFRALKIVN